jgi:hypothetical protein
MSTVPLRVNKFFKRSIDMGLAIRVAVGIVVVVVALAPVQAFAAQGELGTGVPQFGTYSAATGAQTVVWRLDDATTPFPTGCTSIQLTPTTMGMDSYKIAVATMLAARTSGRRVRFFSHAPRDTGCGVDFVEMQ